MPSSGAYASKSRISTPSSGPRRRPAVTGISRRSRICVSCSNVEDGGNRALALVRKGARVLAKGERLSWPLEGAKPARRGFHLRAPLFGSGIGTRARPDLTPAAAGRLVLFVVRVLGRRLPASLQHLRVAGTGFWWHALAQLE